MNRKTNQNTRKHTTQPHNRTQHILYTLFVTNRTKPTKQTQTVKKNGEKKLYEIKRVFIPQRLDAKSHTQKHHHFCSTTAHIHTHTHSQMTNTSINEK